MALLHSGGRVVSISSNSSGSFPSIIRKLPLYSEGRVRPKKGTDHSVLVDNSSSKQRKRMCKACLGWQQDKRIPTPVH